MGDPVAHDIVGARINDEPVGISRRLAQRILKGSNVGEDLTQYDSQLVETQEVFETIVASMHEEGNGLLTAVVITPQDAAKLILGAMMGAANKGILSLYVLECDKFLKAVMTSPPICAADSCDHPITTQTDVGAIVIVHGKTDTPSVMLAAGVCETCWKERFEKNRDQAMEGFLNYLRQCLPGMKSYTQDEFAEQFEKPFAGNAPSSRSVN